MTPRHHVKTYDIFKLSRCLTVCHHVGMHGKRRTPRLNNNVTTVARMLMGRRGMTQTDLANVLDIDKALVSRVFADKRTWQLEEIEDMAEHFNVGPAIFLEDPDDLISRRNPVLTQHYAQHSRVAPVPSPRILIAA